MSEQSTERINNQEIIAALESVINTLKSEGISEISTVRYLEVDGNSIRIVNASDLQN